jgi:hypothetical protein
VYNSFFLFLQIKAQSHEGKGDPLAAIVGMVQTPIDELQGTPGWIRGHVLELALTTLLDLRPSFETDEV